MAWNGLILNFSWTFPDRDGANDLSAWLPVINIRTHEGWLYLSVVLDLFSRQVIGWSMRPRMESELAISALMMAVWRLQSKRGVIVHSDQGSQPEPTWQLP
jgi:transposase InsO family protein